ncbi:uncharacterized protein STEHIDRAFT_165688 [Stereum hirsutum FP-91666 SS1]|uniref:uncharacterized protein n=1 Tax=Stereum hirsutum (strain FP-91666) TaxID=721885 RepID=UPI000440E5E9|nr:uncharacterized protein STEHIDRAFT_165688 [Stereum hirsutum FP-91666 SS1]EIM91361.1 hypothetical protein STEHIDRAFT_165688 [Stereum hirsutum FP-91666 SS1]
MSYPRRNHASSSGVYSYPPNAFYTRNSIITLPPPADFPGGNRNSNLIYSSSHSIASPQTTLLGPTRPSGYPLALDSHPSSHHRPTLGERAPKPLYTPPQPAHHPQSVGFHGYRSADTIEPTHTVLDSRFHHASERDIPQHPWATSETSTDLTVQPHYAPVPTLNRVDQPQIPTMIADLWKSTSDESYNLPVTTESSIPIQYSSPLQPRFSTNLSASRHRLSREFDLRTRLQTHPEHNAPLISAPSFEASAEDVYGPSYDPIIPPLQRTQLEPDTFRADSGFSTTSFSPRRIAPPPSEPSTQSSHTSPQNPPQSSRVAISNPHPQWAMWVGNVPADASQEELFHFFNQSHQHSPPEQDHDLSTLAPSQSSIPGGVTSVFLISHSNCAFVNFESQLQLESAATTFNGRRLRGTHSTGPRLVCRACKPEEYGDGHAGVRRQRRSGVHVKWVRDRRNQGEQPQAPPVLGGKGGSGQGLSTSRPITVEDISLQLRSLSQVANAQTRAPKQDDVSSIPGSPTSTTSGLLSTYFPQRYFILKSLSQSDLGQSVRTGLWVTQPHNEDILNGAYRTSRDVFLIFGVNRSGEFYGYVRMAGLIESSTPTPSAGSSSETHVSDEAAVTHLLPSPRYRIISPEGVFNDERDEQESIRRHHNVSSRQPSSYSDERNTQKLADFGPSHQLVSPMEALSGHTRPPTSNWTSHNASSQHDLRLGPHRPYTEPTQEGDTRERDDVPHHTDTKVLGRPFKVEWIKIDRLPFLRTRHLRNAWNHDRQIKVARDGTELDPDVAHQLFEEWDKPPASTTPSKKTPRSNTKHRAVQSARH